MCVFEDYEDAFCSIIAVATVSHELIIFQCLPNHRRMARAMSIYIYTILHSILVIQL